MASGRRGLYEAEEEFEDEEELEFEDEALFGMVHPSL